MLIRFSDLGRARFAARDLEWSRPRAESRITDDQGGSLIWYRTLAETMGHILHPVEGTRDGLVRQTGVYHVACTGTASRWQWPREILRGDPSPREQRVVPVSIQRAYAREFRTPAARPACTALDPTHFQHAFGFQVPPWPDTLCATIWANP